MTYRVLFIGENEIVKNLKAVNIKIKTTTWKYLSPLYWYDMIIVDNFSTNSKNVRIAIKTKDNFRDFVNDGGILVCLCCRPKNYGGYRSYAWLPGLPSKVKIIANKVNSLKVKRSFLEKFFDRQKANIDIECCFDNIEESSGAEIIATTGLEEVVAFSIKLGKGRIICLPQFKNKKLFLQNWLGFWTSKKPSWLRDYEYKEKRELLSKLKTINKLENLLYGNDMELCKAVAEAFKVLGFEVKISIKGTEPDIYLNYDDFTAIVEVKGLKTHADRDDMRALLDYYDANIDKQPMLKGIFIVNHYREIEPRKKEKPYTNGALELAQRKGFCLLTTTDLYFAIEKAFNDPNFCEAIRKKIIDGVGLTELND
ncbi:hypothetical protein J7L49_00085 [Candidatus Bathyarchaeota archaeon]|nr:hypothetical protein [Candidatus Bathyarchaeota archaeon]